MPAQAARPNVLIVIMDDLGYGDLACLGNPHTTTPNLDRLHGESVRLTRYCSGPLCTPARAALMTGRHPYRTGAIDTYCGRSIIHPDERTLPQVLGDAGYTCGLFGKWHLGDNLPSRPHDLGFHETLHHTGGGLDQPANVGRSSYFDPELIRNGQPEPSRGYCTDVFTDAALAFIDDHQEDPWFCYLATNAPHSPFIVPEAYIQPYRDLGLPEKLARLYGMITNIDDNVGRLLDRLHKLGLADDTLVLFTSDHGPCPSALVDGQVRFNAALRGMKCTMYEGGIRVPCLWRLPSRYPGGRDVDRLANPIDLLPTLANLCGAQTPTDRTVDGRDVGPLLSGEQSADDWPDRSICMQWHRGPLPQRYRNAANLRQDHKWYWPADAKRPELYNLAADPEEQHDLAESDPHRAQQMQGEYETWWDDVTRTRGQTIEENFEPPAIFVGDPRENPTVLTRQDCRLYDATPEGWGDDHPGYWVVDVTQQGPYRLTADLPVLDTPSVLLLRCGTWTHNIPVPANCGTISHDAPKWPTGRQTLEVLLTDERGRRVHATFVHIESLGPAAHAT